VAREGIPMLVRQSSVKSDPRFLIVNLVREHRFINPYTGTARRLVGDAQLLHETSIGTVGWEPNVKPAIGKTITGACNLAFSGRCTGVYLCGRTVGNGAV
jgi:hypothetical protein